MQTLLNSLQKHSPSITTMSLHIMKQLAESIILIKHWLLVCLILDQEEFRGPDIAEESVFNFPFGTVLIGLLKVYVFNIANLHFRFSFAAWDFY